MSFSVRRTAALAAVALITLALANGCGTAATPVPQGPPTPAVTPIPSPTLVPTITPRPTIDPTVAAKDVIIFEASDRVLDYLERIDTLATKVCPADALQVVAQYQSQVYQTMNSFAYKLARDPKHYADPDVQIQVYQTLEAQLKPIVAKLESLCLNNPGWKTN